MPGKRKDRLRHVARAAFPLSVLQIVVSVIIMDGCRACCAGQVPAGQSLRKMAPLEAEVTFAR